MPPRSRWTLAAAVLGSGIVFLDSTVVTVALPRIGEELPTLRIGVLEAQSYIYNAYLLTLSALLILAGGLADRFGRRRIFAWGLVGFGITSVLCGLAPSMELLIAFRVLQGAAGAFLVPGSLAILTATFVGEERGRAFGLWAGASAVTTIVGPVVGGFLVDGYSWRMAFLLNVPIVLVALWATLRHVEESRDEEAAGGFDWLGAGVVAMAVGGLSFGFIRGQERQWQSPAAWIALALGVAAVLVLPTVMRRARRPLVPLELFRSRNFTVTNVSTFLIYGGLYVVLYFLTIFLQGTLDYSATTAGLATVPALVFLALFSPRFGSLAARYGPRRFMAAGPAVMGVGALLLAGISVESGSWRLTAGWMPPTGYLVDVLPGLLVFGAGAMLMVAPLTTALMSSVPERNSGVASAVNNAISRIGPQLAGALIFIVVTATFYAGLSAQVEGLEVTSPEVRSRLAPLNRPAPEVPAEVASAAREASASAFRLAMLLGAGLFGLGAAVNGIGIRDETLRGVGPEPAAESLGGQMCVPLRGEESPPPPPRPVEA